MSAIPDDRAVEDLRTAAEVLRDGNTWVSRGLSGPLADLLDAAADLAGDGGADAVSAPLLRRASVVAGVVTGRPGTA